MLPTHLKMLRTTIHYLLGIALNETVNTSKVFNTYNLLNNYLIIIIMYLYKIHLELIHKLVTKNMQMQ